MTAEENTKKPAKPEKAEGAAPAKTGPVRISSAQKRNKQSLANRQKNKSYKSKVKTAIKDFSDSLTEKNAEKAQEKLNTVFSLMDKGAKKNIFKLNKTSRVKSKLSALFSKKGKEAKV
jgi:small subunit ribosomal protein S20